jgi:hypothetical protein
MHWFEALWDLEIRRRPLPWLRGAYGNGEGETEFREQAYGRYDDG